MTSPYTPSQNPKIAVVVMNLGGPLKEGDIKPFLFNFFMDKNIIGAPLPIRWMAPEAIMDGVYTCPLPLHAWTTASC